MGGPFSLEPARFYAAGFIDAGGSRIGVAAGFECSAKRRNPAMVGDNWVAPAAGIGLTGACRLPSRGENSDAEYRVGYRGVSASDGG